MPTRRFRFIRIPRLLQLYQCPECLLVTAEPGEHARSHLPGYQERPAPGRPEAARYRDVVLEVPPPRDP